MFRALIPALASTATAPVSHAEPFSIHMIVHRAGSGADDGLRDYPKANGVDTEFIFRDMENGRSGLPGYVVEIETLKPDPAEPMLSKRNPTSGRDPGEIPIEALSRFSFAVDIETAHKLKFYPPVEILRFAQFIKTGADS